MDDACEHKGSFIWLLGKIVVTQKELMIQTNMPRFFREGDTMLLPVKLANLSSQNLSGTVQLEWLDAVSNLES